MDTIKQLSFFSYETDNYPLHRLCKDTERDLHKIKKCLEKGININLLDDKGRTAISYAMDYEDFATVKYLLDNHANPNLAGPDSFPPLIKLTIRRQKVMIARLVSHPAIDVNVCEKNNGTALFIAAQLGYGEIVQILLSSGADPTVCMKNNNTSALHIAIAEKNYHIVERLIRYKPELCNMKQIFLEHEISPIHFAAMHGHLEAVQLLLKYGALVNQKDNRNITAIWSAAANGHHEIVHLLLKNDADYEQVGGTDGLGDLVNTLEIAGREGHVECVQVLLQYAHTRQYLIKALHYITSGTLDCIEPLKRDRLYVSSELIKQKLLEESCLEPLSLEDSVSFSWEKSFEILFRTPPSKNDRHPKSKDSAIRYALSAMYGLLQQPEACLLYFQFLSKELDRHWEKMEGKCFPKFNTGSMELWNHSGMLWPIPNEQYQSLKKFSLIERIMLAKFRQYGMGEQQFKWTGYIPKELSRDLLLSNAFFTENRRMISGLFHGNIHNIQRTILLFAMEDGAIPVQYQEADGEIKKLEFKEIFSALMRKDLLPSGKSHAPLWNTMLDSVYYNKVTFSHPHRLHSILLTHPAYIGTLQDYLCYNFCTKFIQMKELHNHTYSKNYTNQDMCNELIKIQFHLFTGLPEFALQLDEKKNIEQVSTIDSLVNQGRDYGIQRKLYVPVSEPITSFLNSV